MTTLTQFLCRLVITAGPDTLLARNQYCCVDSPIQQAWTRCPDVQASGVAASAYWQVRENSS